METKQSIRKEILTKRNSLSPEEQKYKSRKIRENVMTLSEWKHTKNVLLYLNYQSEVMTEELIKSAIREGKNVYLPKVSGNEMEFYRILSIEDTKEGYKGIREPKEDDYTKFIWNDTAGCMMILPGCAFTKNGKRIGYGKGFYDRYLAKVPVKMKIALAYELQIVPQIPDEDNDIPVNKIITEKHIYAVKQGE